MITTWSSLQYISVTLYIRSCGISSRKFPFDEAFKHEWMKAHIYEREPVWVYVCWKNTNFVFVKLCPQFAFNTVSFWYFLLLVKTYAYTQIHWFIQSFVYSFIQSFIHLFTPYCCITVTLFSVFGFSFFYNFFKYFNFYLLPLSTSLLLFLFCSHSFWLKSIQIELISLASYISVRVYVCVCKTLSDPTCKKG